MKTIIAFAVYLLSVCASAQHLSVSGTHFENGVDSKSWGNRTDGNSTVANFKGYTGETFVIFTTDAPVKLTLDYTLQMSRGNAELWFVTDGQKQNLASLKKGAGTSSDKATVMLEPGRKHELRFKGEDAKGTMLCNWEEEPIQG